jgi:hypothetical protein
MMLYFDNSKGNDKTIYIDFPSILEQVHYRIPETTLYRILQKKCKSYRYRNRDLFPFKQLLEIPEIAKDLKIIETDE